MARPSNDQPTPAELEVLHVIWQRGPSTVREVMDILNQRSKRAYTTIMTLMNVMARKKTLIRTKRGRAFVYRARDERDKTLRGMVGDLLQRAFHGSSAAMVQRLLDDAAPDSQEMKAIRQTISQYEKQGPPQHK
jgi:BlaI family transcriptional regulator, penicillinase repressor